MLFLRSKYILCFCILLVVIFCNMHSAYSEDSILNLSPDGHEEQVDLQPAHPENLDDPKLAGKRISSIGISGNYPYLEIKLARYLSVRPSDLFEPSGIQKQLDRIKQFYVREGWIDTKVTVVPEYIPEYDSVALNFKIKRGYLLRYKNINLTGKFSLPAALVASKINTWKPYQPRRLREAIRNISKTYRFAGYPLARVRVVDKNIDYKSHRISITVNIDEGPKVDVFFYGNYHILGKTLRKVITVFSEGAIDTFELEESVKALQKRYRERGFPNAKIRFERKQISEDNIQITFDIDEGKPERIRSVTFIGNNHLGYPSLIKQMQTRPLSFTDRGIFSSKVLNNDTKRLQLFYKSKGFSEVEIEPPEVRGIENGTQLEILVDIDEGPQFKVSKIDFQGDIIFTKKKLVKALKIKVNKPLDFTKLEIEKERLSTFYSNNGYPYAEIKYNLVPDYANNSIRLIYNILPGDLVRFGDISMVGDFLTSQKAIRKAISIKSGEIFSYKRLVDGEVSLRRLGSFASANIIPENMDNKAVVIPLKVKVEEMRPFRLDFDLGYSTDQKFVGTIDFTNLNAFGWAKRAAMRLTGGRKLSRAEIGWIDPKFLGYDLEMTANSWLQYRDKNIFSYIQGGAGIGVFRRHHRTSYLARQDIKRNYFVSGDETVADDESLRNNTILETALSLNFDTRNSFAYPTKGLFVMGYTDFFNEISGNSAHFVKFGIKNGTYYTPWNVLTLANEVRFDNIQTFGKNVSVPANDLLLLGGDETLRGYAENSLGPVGPNGKPVGGRLRFIMSNELRIGLFGNFKGIVFHDMGFLTNSYNAVSLANLRHSIGFGLDYVTPVGPVEVAYAFKIDRLPGESMGRFHIIFGYAF